MTKTKTTFNYLLVYHDYETFAGQFSTYKDLKENLDKRFNSPLGNEIHSVNDRDKNVIYGIETNFYRKGKPGRLLVLKITPKGGKRLVNDFELQKFCKKNY